MAAALTSTSSWWPTVLVTSALWLLLWLYDVLWLKPIRLIHLLEEQGIKGPPFKFLMGNMPDMAAVGRTCFNLRLVESASQLNLFPRTLAAVAALSGSVALRC